MTLMYIKYKELYNFPFVKLYPPQNDFRYTIIMFCQFKANTYMYMYARAHDVVY